jgi:hypothetical protein
MVNAYKLGGATFTLKNSSRGGFYYSKEVDSYLFKNELVLLGATPLETEIDDEEFCMRCGLTKGEETGGGCSAWGKHWKYHKYLKPEREEIEMPEYLGNVLGRQVEATNAMNDWMKAVTNMLNRHEQLFREEA